LTYKIAESDFEKTEARKVITNVFVDELGYSDLRTDRFDKLSTFIIANLAGKTIAALRLIPDSAEGLPIEEHLDLTSLRTKNSKLGEVSRLACLKEYRNHTVVHQGLGFFKELVQTLDISHLVIESLLRTTKLYQSFGFTPIDKPFYDPTVAASPGDMSPNSLAMLIRAADIRLKVVV
jgi:predicted GNAT family N-acyltransferase